MAGGTKYFVTAACLAAAASCSAQDPDFQWSWEDPARAAAAAPAAPVEPGKGEAGKSGVETELVEIAEELTAPATAQAEKGGPRGAEYERLVKENLELRGNLDTLRLDVESAKSRHAAVASELAVRERKIGEMAAAIKAMKEQGGGAAGSESDTAELEARLKDAEQKRAKLSAELAEMAAKVAAMEAADKASPPSVQPGTDLFEQVRKENALLQKRWAEAEGERRKLEAAVKNLSVERADLAKAVAGAGDQRKKIEDDLARARSDEEKYLREIAKARAEAERAEKEAMNLGAKLVEKEAVMSAKDREARQLSLEMERRERRIDNAARVYELLDKARERLKDRDSAEKRDLHYNMAAVYAKEGRPRDAEREYLRALQMDPNDADVHFNLGILYEQDLGNSRRAALHYRKYLELNPHAEDVDAVRRWLREIELGGR